MRAFLVLTVAVLLIPIGTAFAQLRPPIPNCGLQPPPPPAPPGCAAMRPVCVCGQGNDCEWHFICDDQFGHPQRQ